MSLYAKESPVKNVLINADGGLVCPGCGARQQFSYRRTAAGKVAMGVTAGVLGALALPKRLQCIGCQEYLKSSPRPVEQRESGAVAFDRTPTSGGTALQLEAGPIQVLVTDCEWDGKARISMLKAARPGLRDHAYERMVDQLRRREPAPVAALTEVGAQVLSKRLEENGFTTTWLGRWSRSPAWARNYYSRPRWKLRSLSTWGGNVTPVRPATTTPARA